MTTHPAGDGPTGSGPVAASAVPPGAGAAGSGLWGGHVRMEPGEAQRIASERWAFDGRAERVDTEKDDTFVLTAADGAQRVLKVSNPAEDPAEVDFEVRVVHHVATGGSGVPVPRVFEDRDGALLAPLVDAAGQHRHARLLSYLAGTPLDAVDATAAQREQIGMVLGRLRHATAGFAHPAQHRVLAWDVQHLPSLAPLLGSVTDPMRQALLAEGLARFEHIAPVLPGLRRQVLHNDFSRSNLIVDPARAEFVTGVIDFGDTTHTAIAVDVSTALLNQLPRTLPADTDPPAHLDLFADARDVLRGYLRVADLTASELAVIPHLVMGRAVARALITLRRAAAMPENARYVLRNTEPGWGQLRWFLARDDDVLRHLLTPANGTDPR